MNISHKEHQRQVRTYEQQQHRYEMYAELLKAQLRAACAELKIEAAVQARAKAKTSFAEKVIRKHREYPDAIHQMTDLCGARVITYRQRDATRVEEFIKHNFTVDWKRFEDVRLRLKPDQFGYQAIHYIVQMPWVSLEGRTASSRIGSREADQAFDRALARVSRAKYKSLNAHLAATADPLQQLDLLWTALKLVLKRNPHRWRGCHSELDLVRNIGNRKAEIQVCTVLQHAWAAVGHDRLYKGDFQPPSGLKRKIHRVAALLETADDELSKAIDDVDEFRLDYGAYMPPDRIREEITKWQTALGNSKDVGISLKIADLAAAIEDWKSVVKTLTPLLHSSKAPERTDPRVFRALGRAKHRRRKGGVTELKAALKANEDDVETLRYLGDLYCNRASSNGKCPPRGCDGADYYARAFKASPAEPYAVARYVECSFCSGAEVGELNLLRPVIEAARAKSLSRAEIHVHMPWALFELGEFELILGRLPESIGAYAKAVFVSDSEKPIAEALVAVGKLIRGFKRKPEGHRELQAHGEQVKRFLQMAVVAKLRRMVRDTREELAAVERDLSMAKLVLGELGRTHGAAGTREQAEKVVGLTEKRKRCRRLLQDLETKTEKAQAAFPASELRGRRPRTGNPYRSIHEPVVIVAGSCDARYEQEVRQHRPLIVAAFRRFHGTVFSAGTTAGIGGIIGEIQKECGARIRAIAYLPKTRPPGVEVDTRYKELRTMPGSDFSVAQPLQCWADMIADGIDPCDVRVLGINGGSIAAAEYRIALAFGATVAVLEDSGREAARLLPDENWGKSERLIVLPQDEDILREYLRTEHARLPPSMESARERLARRAHETFREAMRTKPPDDPATYDWKQLDNAYKESSRRQIDSMLDTLREAEYSWRSIPADLECALPSFSQTQIEKAARAEHARYVIERLRAGWRYGENKSLEHKTNPTLLPWDRLPEHEQKKDSAAVEDFPKRLQDCQIQVEPIPPSPAARQKSLKPHERS
ncbi:MAG: RyR domain-containing protein [candidate division WOR-3 bacterium]|nr:RyR domain-containing protein [candidate division WOR-3 bacterium]